MKNDANLQMGIRFSGYEPRVKSPAMSTPDRASLLPPTSVKSASHSVVLQIIVALIRM